MSEKWDWPGEMIVSSPGEMFALWDSIQPFLEQRRLTPKERIYRNEVNRLLKQVNNFDNKAVKEVIALLSNTRDSIISKLGSLTKDEFKFRNMNQILSELNVSIEKTFQSRYEALLTDKIAGAVELGKDFIDKPILAANLGISAQPIITSELAEIGAFLSADLVTDVSNDMRKKINVAVRLGLLGERGPQEIITELSKDKNFRRGVFKTVKDRAEIVTRTEVNRAINLSNQKRIEQWADEVPELEKYWLDTSDNRTRPSHRAVGRATNPNRGGKPIGIKQKFLVSGRRVNGPHDPNLSAKDVVACRCVLVTVLREGN